jgi:nucleoside-diphosphate-sugar epimerase
VAVVAHVRPDSPRLERWRRDFAHLGAAVDVTAWEPEAVRDTLAVVRPAFVFSLLGTTRARARRAGGGESYASIDLGLTLMLLRAAVACGSRPRFIFLSAVGADPRARTEYMRVRGRVEAEVRRSGLPWLIARPTLITGPDRDERRPWERAGAALMDAALLIAATFGAGGWRARYASTTGGELARALVDLALDPAPESRVVDAAELRRRGAPATTAIP